jgi:hypothetical protein
MTDRQKALADVQHILWAARMEAAAHRWHLDRRAVPRLNALAAGADEARLQRAVAKTSEAIEHLVAAKDMLGGVIDLVEACNPDPGEEGEPGSA